MGSTPPSAQLGWASFEKRAGKRDEEETEKERRVWPTRSRDSGAAEGTALGLGSSWREACRTFEPSLSGFPKNKLRFFIRSISAHSRTTRSSQDLEKARRCTRALDRAVARLSVG